MLKVVAPEVHKVEKRLGFPFIGHFKHDVLIVLVVLQRKIDCTNNYLSIANILDNIRVK